MKKLFFCLLDCYLMSCSVDSLAQHYQPHVPEAEAFQLVFQDEFDGAELDWQIWDSENAIKKSPSGQKVLRHRANAFVEDGLLKLMIRKESLQGSDWTAAFVWLRETYAANTYYECRFVNSKATGVNNAFWMACKTSKPRPYENRYEIDCPENKVHVDGSIYAHLAWHDWKTSSYLGGKHIAQGFGKQLPDSGFQTWGLWIGESEFAIYCNGQLQWDGKTHPRYTHQYCSGVGKFPEWNAAEEKRAYGRYGQDDWCYFGGMNGDQLNVCLSTMPWHSKGTPLTDSAHNTFMGVDYLRIFKRKSDLEITPVQQASEITSGARIELISPAELSKDENRYFSFLVNREAASDVSFSLLTENGSVSTLRLTAANTIEIDNGSAVASTGDSYPNSDRLGSAVPVGSEVLVVVRITGQSTARDIVSCKCISTDSPISESEPFLYRNIDDRGNTSVTTEWDLAQKIDSSQSVAAVVFEFNDAKATCSEFKVAANYLAVVNEQLMSTGGGSK